MNLPRLQFRPRLFEALRGYRRADFQADVSAGITVGVVALPLAMAFGIASGVKPEQGIITAIIAGFLISALGGSRVQIGGPAGAFVALLYAIVERYGVANLLIATFMAGILLFAMGAIRLGGLIRFVPVPIIVGFTNGIAVVIALHQVKDFLGLQIERMPVNSLSQVHTLGSQLHTINMSAFAVGLVALILVVVWPKSYQQVKPGWRRWLAVVPGTLAALIVGTLLVKILALPVETIGSRFGGIPQSLPVPALPAFNWETVQNLVTPTIAIAMLGAIESLLCARVADGMIDDRHDPNQELMAQGIANVVTPFFGGIAATGTIARTVTNVRTGARSPIAGMIHALTLLMIVLLAAPLAYDIPLAALAGILLVVAWNMGEWHAFVQLRQFSNTYRVILVGTFLLTVVFDLTVAIEVGMLLASLFFIYRIASVTRLQRLEVTVPGMEVWQLFGSLFFGSVSRIETLMDPLRPCPRILVLDLHQVISLDTTGLDSLRSLQRFLQKREARLVIAAANEQPLSLLERSGFTTELGPQGLFVSVADALSALQVSSTAESPSR